LGRSDFETTGNNCKSGLIRTGTKSSKFSAHLRHAGLRKSVLISSAGGDHEVGNDTAAKKEKHCRVISAFYYRKFGGEKSNS
jgi:hypothetical protein